MCFLFRVRPGDGRVGCGGRAGRSCPGALLAHFARTNRPAARRARAAGVPRSAGPRGYRARAPRRVGIGESPPPRNATLNWALAAPLRSGRPSPARRASPSHLSVWSVVCATRAYFLFNRYRISDTRIAPGWSAAIGRGGTVRSIGSSNLKVTAAKRRRAGTARPRTNRAVRRR